MEIVEYTLFGKMDRVEQAVERLRLHEPEEGYWLADSYGKDSTVVLELAQLAGVKFEAHHNRTTLDPPELMRFGRTHHAETTECAPKERFEDTLLRKRCPPMRHIRWCCDTLKEDGGVGRIVVTGIRWDESTRRRKTRKMFEHCYQKKRAGTRYLNPIIDWTTADVWEFLNAGKLPRCVLYERGWKRIGCLMCPMAGPETRARHAREYPRFARRYIRAFQKLVDLGHADGTAFTWKTGQECFEWWMKDYRGRKRDVEGQVVMLDQD